MKKSRIYLCLILILSVNIFLFNSCKKERPTDVGGLPSQPVVNIAKFQAIYITGIHKPLTIQSTPSQAVLNLIVGLNVDWTTFIITPRGDSSIVNEFDMLPDSTLFTLHSLNMGDTVKYHNKTSVVFIESPKGGLNFFMKVIEDLTASGNKKSVINYVHYGHISSTFSGQILYYTLDRQYMNGYRYANGQITGLVSIATKKSQQELQVQSTDKLKVNLASSCETTDVYSSWCTYYGYTNTSGDSVWDISECGQDYIGSFTVCYSNFYGGGASGDNGGGQPTPDCPIITQSIHGKLSINVAQNDGGDGSDGTTTSPCPVVPQTPPETPPVGFRPLCKSSIVLTPASSNSSEVNMAGVTFGILDEPHFPLYTTQINVIEFNLYINIPNEITNPDDRSKTVVITPTMQKEFIYQAYHFASEQTNLLHGEDFFAVNSQPKYSAIFAAYVALYLNTIALQGMFTYFENNNSGMIPSLGARVSTLINPLKATPAHYTIGSSGQGC